MTVTRSRARTLAHFPQQDASPSELDKDEMSWVETDRRELDHVLATRAVSRVAPSSGQT